VRRKRNDKSAFSIHDVVSLNTYCLGNELISRLLKST
jgi:hypothetical protein